MQSLADKAYHAIRGLIVSLALAPGALIDERELIERLGIGRTPVREALRRLAQEQLVEVYPRRGMFVTPVDARALARLSEVRAVLEPEAARLAAERATVVPTPSLFWHEATERPIHRPQDLVWHLVTASR